jgi:exosortase family protein XrtF
LAAHKPINSSTHQLLKEFKPSLIFIAKFLGLYLSLNILYGIFVESFDRADPITSLVTHQSAAFINIFGDQSTALDNPEKATVFINRSGKPVLSVYEGCNGINVMIVFLSFIFSFPGISRIALWFVPLGIFLIHLFNLGRIGLLYWVTLNMPGYMYFTHKYFFTAILYILVFVLWYIWVVKIIRVDPSPKSHTAN